MIVYKDIITGDELLSDSYPYKDIDGVLLEVPAKLITKGGNVECNIGANPSQEEQEEALDDGQTERVLDVVDAHKLVPTGIDKKGYMGHLKLYMKAVKAKIEETKSEEAAKEFQANVQPVVKQLLSEFKELDFYLGESMNPDGMMVLLKYKDIDGNDEPFFYFFKDGLVEEKY